MFTLNAKLQGTKTNHTLREKTFLVKGVYNFCWNDKKQRQRRGSVKLAGLEINDLCINLQ